MAMPTKQEWTKRAEQKVKRTQLFINGKFVDPVEGKTMDFENPAIGQVYGQAPLSTAPDVDAAFKAATNGMTKAQVTAKIQEGEDLIKVPGAAAVVAARERVRAHERAEDAVLAELLDQVRVDREGPVFAGNGEERMRRHADIALHPGMHAARHGEHHFLQSEALELVLRARWL